MIRDKYAYMGLKEGMRVLVYTVPLEGEPATIQTINRHWLSFKPHKNAYSFIKTPSPVYIMASYESLSTHMI